MRFAALALVAACHGSSSSSNPVALRAVTLAPTTGIGFDDLAFAPGLHAVLAPAGATGELDLVDTTSLAIRAFAVFKDAGLAYRSGHHDAGITSAAVSPDRIFVTDRTHRMIVSFEREGTRDQRSALAGEPDYVRVVFGEVWVTEPDAAQIEVFDASLKTMLAFAVPGGPESLVVSASRKTAYANLWRQKTVEIDVAKHAIVRTFDSGCDKTRGLALDDAGGGLFVACSDGRVARVDLSSGKISAEGRAGDGVDIIDFSPKTGHLYVPASRAGTLTVFDAKLAAVKTAPVPKGAHCVVADDAGRAWICDPDHGSLVVFSENP